MSCESCNRNNVFKAFCYFSRRQEYFKSIREVDFSPESFVLYALEVDLKWQVKTYCSFKLQTEFNMYWEILKPVLIRLLHERKTTCQKNHS